jgi:hypothetical protein
MMTVAGCGGGTTRPAAVATLTPTPTLTPTSATLSFQDPMTAANHDAGWTNNTAPCQTFQSDGLLLTFPTPCWAPANAFANGTVSVQARQTSGHTDYGYALLFRGSQQARTYYGFEIDGDGKWLSFKATWGGLSYTASYFEQFTANAAIKTGLNASNTLRVDMNGSHFDNYVNGTKVGQDDDSSIASGQVGLYDEAGNEVVFTNLTVQSKP